MKKQRSKMGVCLANGVSVYPVFQSQRKVVKTEKGKEDKIYLKGNWYLEVDNNGVKTRYPKSVGIGSTLSGPEYGKSISKVYDHWYDLIQKSK